MRWKVKHHPVWPLLAFQMKPRLQGNCADPLMKSTYFKKRERTKEETAVRAAWKFISPYLNSLK